MVRELPINNGRLTTDLDADGHRINNLAGGLNTVTWSDVTGKPSFATVATSGSYNDLDNKPTIPAAVTVDATLTTQGAAADAKAVGDALRGGFTEWEYVSGMPAGVHAGTPYFDEGYSSWICHFYGSDDSLVASLSIYAEDENATTLVFTGSIVSPSEEAVAFTRHLVTPTKTSQLENDGAPNGGGTPYATTADIPDVPGAYTSTPAMDGVGSAGSATTWAKGDHVHPTDTSRAAASDLPYALVTPGEWAFSGNGYDPNSHVYAVLEYEPIQPGDMYSYELYIDGQYEEDASEQTANPAMAVVFVDSHITATRDALPGHLCDRAVNAMSISSITNITLPALSYPGQARDFILLLDIPSSVTNTVPGLTGLLTFTPSGSETVHYYVDGDDPSSAEFPVPTSPGTWSYSFTEFKASWFAISLKQIVEAVPPSQSNGGAQ